MEYLSGMRELQNNIYIPKKFTNLWTRVFCSECQALSVDFLVVMLNVDNGNWGENCEQHLHDEDSKLIWAAGAGAELNWNAQEGVNAQFLET